MDSLKTLMDKKQYELVIKLTENTTDPTSIFFRISAFLALGKAEESLACLEANSSILQADLLLTIKVHIEILCIMNQFDKAYEVLKKYEDFPYASQEVEEMLREMPEYIRNEERRAYSSNKLDDEGVRKLLRSKDMNDSIIALDLVRDRDINSFMNDIKWLMVNHPLQSIRSFSLLILVQKKIDGLFKFLHVDKIIEVNPSQLIPPFVGEPFNSITKKLALDFNNPPLSDNATQILSTYIMFIYPEEIKDEEEEIIEALYQISSDYLQSKKEDLSIRCKEKNLDRDKVQELIDNINFALKNF